MSWGRVMKPNMRFSRLLLSLVGLLVVGANAASAATFTYSSYDVTNEQNISISAPNSISGGAGQIVLIGSGANVGQTILAYCLNIYTYLQGAGTYQIGPLTTAGSGSPNPALTNTQISEIGSLIVNGNALISTSHDVSAAVQLAIWEVEYGAGFTFTGLDAGAKSLASTYLTNVGAGGIWASSNYNVSLLSQTGNQNLAFVNPTPIPAALPLFAGGLGVFGLLARRRKRKAPLAIA